MNLGMQKKGNIPRKQCITVQPSEVGAKFSTSKSPLRKCLGVQDINNLSEVVATRPHIKNWIDKEGGNISN